MLKMKNEKWKRSGDMELGTREGFRIISGKLEVHLSGTIWNDLKLPGAIWNCLGWNGILKS